MTKTNISYLLIETQEQLRAFYKKNKNAEWLAFDTEFISEKYYNHRLCLISVSTYECNYIIDVLKLRQINLFNKLIEDPKIMKITHAGENDYQILVNDYKIKPKNIYDTQIAAGFLRYDYPASLQRLLNKELNVSLDKNLTVSDWEQRPLSPKQFEYALNDVIYLSSLMLFQKEKLEEKKRFEWVIEECQKMEHPEFYFTDPVSKLLDNKYAYNLGVREKLFLYRLHQWRTIEAIRRDIPERKIFNNDIIKTVVNLIASGRPALENDRRIHSNILYKYWPLFEGLYEKKATPKEKLILAKYATEPKEDSYQDIMGDMLYLSIRYIATEAGIAHEIVLPKKEINMMKSDPNYYPVILNESWRKKLLGKDFLKLINKRSNLKFEIKKNKFILNFSDS